MRCPDRMGCVDVTVLLDECWDERLSDTSPYRLPQQPAMGADNLSPPMERSSGWTVANRTFDFPTISRTGFRLR